MVELREATERGATTQPPSSLVELGVAPLGVAFGGPASPLPPASGDESPFAVVHAGVATLAFVVSVVTVSRSQSACVSRRV